MLWGAIRAGSPAEEGACEAEGTGAGGPMVVAGPRWPEGLDGES